ncbi:Uncharacterised protein [Mycobacteroides abscessus subsp. abscessus]|uniref:hypothetical protein n=1 Tax=Mycobacteroides abscessus TaxID=36809 RepID=UPI0009B10BF5|nr:hypothetical protein [Mycobacteroides abscessus]SLL09638.1 Uncharacterised protein [Mycobacteroides abscessus subsp. abscessus]
MTPDPYPDLPALPRAVQLACQTIEPAHLTMPPEDLHVVIEVSQAIHHFVAHCTSNLGTEVVEMTTYRAEVRGAVGHEALNNSGDVTPSD